MKISFRMITLFSLTGMFLASLLFAAQPNERVSPTPMCNKNAVVWRGLEQPKHPQSGDVWVNPLDGMEMVYIREGKFRMGNRDIADERPEHDVRVDAYWMSRYEVTVAQYRKYCDITGHAMPLAPKEGWLNQTPIVNVSWHDAADYAKWANAQLPSEAQWEKAARGAKNYAYPWGKAWDQARCNNGLDGKNAPMKVGSFPGGISRYGVMDMAGNAAEWCDGIYRKYGDPTEYRVIRGGSSYDITPESYRTSHRDYLPPTANTPVLGFRYVTKAD